jgi:hypothetical protein
MSGSGTPLDRAGAAGTPILNFRPNQHTHSTSSTGFEDSSLGLSPFKQEGHSFGSPRATLQEIEMGMRDQRACTLLNLKPPR